MFVYQLPDEELKMQKENAAAPFFDFSFGIYNCVKRGVL